MPGAWELRAAKEVLVAVLHVETTTIAWSFGLRNLAVPGQVVGLSGMPYDHARNAACQKALAEGYRWLFFLDSDVVPPRDAILRLLSHQAPLVSGLYCRRSPPHGVPVAIRNGQWVTQYQPGSTIEVDYVGAGCLLIHRSVLERLPPLAPGKPWFHWRVDMQGHLPPGECLSEDFAFCQAAKTKLGIKVLLDTSIVCRHIGHAEARPGTFTPLENVA